MKTNKDYIKKAVVFSKDFRPDEQLESIIKSIIPDGELFLQHFITLNTPQIMYNNKVIEYVENNQRLLYGNNVCIGKETTKRKIGFYGIAVIVEIDTFRNWGISYNNVDIPYIQYKRICVRDDGYTYMINIE